VKRRYGSLQRTGEDRPWRRLAPAGDAGIGFELQNDVLHRACNVTRTMAAHQAYRNLGDEYRHRRDLDLLQETLSPLSPTRSIAHYACQPQRGNAMRRNLLRERLNAGKPTVGTHILSAWPTLVELIGHSKQYDYVEFTAEYAPFDLHDLDNLGRAFELSGMSGMIKIEQTQYTHQAMRAIGAGFQSVLFADIRSVEDTKAAVDAVRAETTMTRGVRGRGRLGVGMRRDVGTVREGGSPAYVDALNEVVIAIMVEKKSCVDNLDAILSVPGIDMVQFGASDFSMSIGKTGQYGHPDVLAANRAKYEAIAIANSGNTKSGDDKYFRDQ